MRTGGELVVAALRAHGVDTVFGIPGSHNLEIYRHLGPAGLRHITPRHEQGAGYAADGYARVSGRPGVVVTTSGPGVFNVATAAGQAYSDSVPLLLISAGMPVHHERGSGLLHEAKDQSAAMAAICARSRRIHTAAEIPRAVAAVFAGFVTGRPRPVHLDIPVDVLGTAVEVTEDAEAPPVPVAPMAPVRSAVAAAGGALVAAKRPAIVAGGGCRDATSQLREIAEALAAPVVTTANGKGVVPESHPLSLGAALHVPEVRGLLRAADVVLAVGTELAETDTWDGPLRLPGRIVRVDVDADALHRPVVAAHPLLGDAVAVLAELRPAIVPAAARPLPPLTAVRTAIQAHGSRWHGIVAALRAALPPTAVLVNDTAQICYFGALTGFGVDTPRSFLYPTGFGTLGYALPAAIGAGVAAAERTVAVLTGDGGLQFTVNELATAVDLGLSLPIVVVNNNGYGMIKQEMAALGIPPLAVDLHTPDFPALGRAYGAEGIRVTSPAELRDAVREALRAPCPSIVEVPEPASLDENR